MYSYIATVLFLSPKFSTGDSQHKPLFFSFFLILFCQEIVMKSACLSNGKAMAFKMLARKNVAESLVAEIQDMSHTNFKFLWGWQNSDEDWVSQRRLFIQRNPHFYQSPKRIPKISPLNSLKYKTTKRSKPQKHPT